MQKAEGLFSFLVTLADSHLAAMCVLAQGK